MRILITGTPGVGKSTIASRLGKALKHKVVSEKTYCEKHNIGKWDSKTRERVVPISRLEKSLSAYLQKHEKVIIEGHLSCECRLRPMDAVVVVRLPPDRLEFRLHERRGYSEVKIQDNVLCEGIDYCAKWARRKYGKRVFEVSNDKELKYTLSVILRKLHALQKEKKT